MYIHLCFWLFNHWSKHPLLLIKNRHHMVAYLSFGLSTRHTVWTAHGLTLCLYISTRSMQQIRAIVLASSGSTGSAYEGGWCVRSAPDSVIISYCDGKQLLRHQISNNVHLCLRDCEFKSVREMLGPASKCWSACFHQHSISEFQSFLHTKTGDFE